uniref:Uncharacterized protein n=1 Tax=Panagrolaimus sp. PS1159 TaxID=55785 RepID=A0AC35F6S9_9BILA
MKLIFGIFIFFCFILSLFALPIERINDIKAKTQIRVRRQWGMPMGGFGGMPMGGFGGMPMGGWGMPPVAANSHGHATKFTSIQMPFFSMMSGSTSGMGSSFIGK